MPEKLSYSGSNDVFLKNMDGEGSESTDEMKSSFERPPSPTNLTDKSSWSLLKKLFKESKNPQRKDSDSDFLSTGKKTRRISVDVGKDNIATKSPTLMRRVSMTGKSSIKRKPSASGGNSKSTRKFSTANTQENLLHFAVIESDLNTLQKIVEANKVDINYMRPPGLSALHQACVSGNISIVELLIANGADVNVKTWSGLSSVQIATLFGHFEVAQFLISSGASSIDIQNGFNHDLKLMSTVLVR